MIIDGCPICGYGDYQIKNQSEIGLSCKSCGCAFDFDYDKSPSNDVLQRIRNKWVTESGGSWYSNYEDEPIDYSSHRQMKDAGMEYPLIPTLMAFFHKDLVDDEFTKQWADDHLESTNDDFEHIMMLSLNGAKHCSKVSTADFPCAREFNFIEEFALRAHQCNTKDIKLVDDFVLWFTFNYHYGSDDPRINEVLSVIDLIIDDTGLSDARNYFFKVFHELKDKTKDLNKQLWDEIK